MEVKVLNEKSNNIYIKKNRIDYEEVIDYINRNVSIFIKDMDRFGARYLKKVFKKNNIKNISIQPAYDETTKEHGYVVFVYNEDININDDSNDE
jgi:hypothetical protein